MSSAAIPPASLSALHTAKGATALSPDLAEGAPPAHGHRYVLGNALRAVKVFGRAAFSVVVLGEYGEDDPSDRRGDRRTEHRTERRSHRHT
ncbi:hypothetical protein [Streptomyces sp. NPDC020742]|uniref:hypothetical protein n=1 Tax=unclassified Streptomyces TaxID=2593676 RepID=UPI0033EDD73B